MERFWQVENPTLKKYTKLLINPSLLQIFKTDNDIDTFWGFSAHERQTIWNNPVALQRFTLIDRGYSFKELEEVSSETTLIIV